MLKHPVNTKALSEYIGVKTSTIYSWTHGRQIPHVKLGGRVLFDLKDIDKWVDKKKVKVFKYKEIEA